MIKLNLATKILLGVGISNILFTSPTFAEILPDNKSQVIKKRTIHKLNGVNTEFNSDSTQIKNTKDCSKEVIKSDIVNQNCPAGTKGQKKVLVDYVGKRTLAGHTDCAKAEIDYSNPIVKKVIEDSCYSTCQVKKDFYENKEGRTFTANSGSCPNGLAGSTHVTKRYILNGNASAVDRGTGYHIAPQLCSSLSVGEQVVNQSGSCYLPKNRIVPELRADRNGNTINILRREKLNDLKYLYFETYGTGLTSDKAPQGATSALRDFWNIARRANRVVVEIKSANTPFYFRFANNHTFNNDLTESEMDSNTYEYLTPQSQLNGNCVGLKLNNSNYFTTQGAAPTLKCRNNLNREIKISDYNWGEVTKTIDITHQVRQGRYLVDSVINVPNNGSYVEYTITAY